VDLLEQYTVSHLKYEKWRDGVLVRTELQRFPLRWYGLEEFELVLSSLGYAEIVVSADYEYGGRPSDPALHELQRLQAARRADGGVPPPAAIDVDVTGVSRDEP
jgi:hypothetical protein